MRAVPVRRVIVVPSNSLDLVTMGPIKRHRETERPPMIA